MRVLTYIDVLHRKFLAMVDSFKKQDAQPPVSA